MSDSLVEAQELHNLYHDSTLCPQRECYLADLVALVERAVKRAEKAEATLRHHVWRNHEYSPLGCAGCGDARKILGEEG